MGVGSSSTEITIAASWHCCVASKQQVRRVHHIRLVLEHGYLKMLFMRVGHVMQIPEAGTAQHRKGAIVLKYGYGHGYANSDILSSRISIWMYI
jgi:hypothetical protein